MGRSNETYDLVVEPDPTHAHDGGTLYEMKNNKKPHLKSLVLQHTLMSLCSAYPLIYDISIFFVKCRKMLGVTPGTLDIKSGPTRC